MKILDHILFDLPNMNYLIPPSPAFRRKIWHYNKADKELLQRSLREFPWRETLSTLLNIMSNFIPNKIVKIDPKNPPWITNNFKNIIKRQNKDRM